MRVAETILFALAIAGGQLRAQKLVVGAGAGFSATGMQPGPSARLTLAQSIAWGMGIGLDVVYVSGALDGTGSFCGYAGCDEVRQRLGFGLLHIGVPVLSWSSGPAPRVGVWLGPYVGCWIRCYDPETSQCPRPSTAHAGFAGGIAAVAVVGRRRLGLAVRYAHGPEPTLALGGGNNYPTMIRPGIVSVLVTLSSGS